jgi:cytochrome P450
MGMSEAGGVPIVAGSALLGSARDLQRDQLGTYDRAMHAHGDHVRFRIGPPRIGFTFDAVFDPAGARSVLSGATDAYIKDAPVMAEFRRLFGEGLFTFNGDAWRQRRRMLQPLFTRRRVAAHLPLMVEQAEALARKLGDRAQAGSEPRLETAAMAYATNVLGTAMFGDDIADAGPVIDRAFPVVNHHAARRGLAPVRLPMSVPTPANRAILGAQRSLHGLIDRLILDRRDGAPTDDLLGLLMQLRDPESGESLDATAIRDEALIFLLAGLDTPGGALPLILYLLGQDEPAQERVRQEAREAARTGDWSLDALPYTSRVVDEGLRLYPPAHTVPRMARTETTLHGHPIPEGHIVAVNMWGLHRNPRVWSEPGCFRPDRFEEEAVAGRDSYAYLPFGGGPRTCIGIHLARAELTVGVAVLLRSLRVHAGPAPPPVHAGVTLSPGALRCRFERVT